MSLNKKMTLLSLWSLLMLGCDATHKRDSGEAEVSPIKYWNMIPVDMQYVKARSDSFNMFNSEGQKVGSMEVEVKISDGKILYKDISQFDNGSLYEEADFRLNTDSLNTEKISIEMDLPQVRYEVDFDLKNSQVKGPFKIFQGSNERVVELDSLYDFDAVRVEIYAYIGALELKDTTTRNLKIFAPLSGRVANAKLTYRGEERITIGLGDFETFHYSVDGGGVIPANELWIDKDTRKIVRIFVPAQALDIQLVESR